MRANAKALAANLEGRLLFNLAIYGLPNSFRANLYDRNVIGHERRVFDDRLSGEHAVEWIAMFSVECSGGNRMLIGDGQMRKSVGGDEFAKVCHRVFSAGQFANAMLGCYFPDGGRADEDNDALVLDRVQRFLR